MDEAPRCYRHPNRETYISCSECGRPICEECMSYAPVGIRCPDHATVGAVKRRPQRTVRQARARAGSLETPVTMALITLNVLVYLISVSQGGGINDPGGTLIEKGALAGALVADGDWWRLLTASFLHANLIHLGFNMLVLWMLGPAIEHALGSARFLLLYLAAGLAGSAGALLVPLSRTSAGFDTTYDPFQVTVGASGAIWGLFGALLILEYLATRSLAGQAMTLIVVNLVITFAIPNISIGGHIGGLVGGVAATFALMRTRFSRNVLVGPALVALVAVASVALAYLRVESVL